MKAILVLAFILVSCHGWKLNVPRVLLPLADEGAKFLVYSEGGCFSWTSTRPEVVKANPTQNPNTEEKTGDLLEITQEGCTSAALIQLPPRWGGSPSLAKTQAVVTATDFHSDGHILRCDVIVDRIHRLQIVTKTLELFLEEAPEEFSVRGYDDQGNEFSTLEGIVFTWTVEASSKKGDNVKFIKFRDSTYALEPTLMELEAKGSQGSKVLLEGVRTGSSKVSVRLASKSYADVPPAEVTVMVVANLFLVPHFSFVMSGATIHYHAEQMRNNKIQLIDLADSQQYFLEVGDDFARTHPKDKNIIIAGSLPGETTVYLKDLNVGRDESVKSPSAELHIVNPAYIMIDIDPHNNWNVLENEYYSLSISVYDAQNHRLFPSSNLVAELEIEEGYFKVEKTVENGTWIYGKPLKIGSAVVRAVLHGIKDTETGELKPLENALKAKAQMEIFSAIDLSPPVIYFPWDPSGISMNQVAYKVKGHEKTSFSWTSDNKTVATVAQNGVARISGQLGSSKVTASMTRASHNKGQAEIFVLPIAGISIFKDRRLEVVTGEKLILPVNMMGQPGNNFFTQCDKVELKTNIADKTLASLEPNLDLEEELPNESCTHLTLLGLNMGFTKLTVSHQYQTPEGKAVKVSDFVTLGVLEPLAPVQPQQGTAVLSVGSSVDIVWKGGPQPWILNPESHFHNLKVDVENLIEIEEKKLAVPVNFYVYTVTCNKLGETTLEIQVGNAQTHSLPHPVILSSTVKVICAEPDRLQLEASPERPEGPCPLMAKNGRVAALCYEDLLINVSVFDSNGRKFDNYSSLDISWSNSNEDLAELKQEKGVLYSEEPNKSFYKPFSTGQGFQILQNKEITGNLDITGTLKKPSYLMGRSTSDTLELDLVNDAEISPPKIALFNHAENSANFYISQGSGYFEVSSSESGIASHKYTASNRSIEAVPTSEGSTILKVRDLCLLSKSQKSKSLVNVIGVHSVELKVLDQVQIGTEISASVQLKDQFGEVIDISKIKNSQLQITLMAANKEIALIQDQNIQKSIFQVKGASLGHTTLTAFATYGGKKVPSVSMPLNVFPALELEPRNITLIIGAKFQVQVLGGPEQLDSNIEFSINNGKIANLDSSGLISAMTLGSTKVTARAIRGTNGQKITFSEDSVDVHVVKFHGVKIKAPIFKMRAGTEMPLSLVGLDKSNQNAFAFGSALPNLQIEWKLSNQEVANLESPFWKNGIEINGKNNGAMRFVAKKAGRTSVKLHAKITAPIDVFGQNQFDRDMEFTDEIEVTVFEDLTGKSPYIGKNTLIMGPMTTHQIKTNRDGISGAKTTYSVLPNLDGTEIVSVSKTGKITSKRLLGSAVILVKTTEDNAVIQELSIVVQVKSVSYLMLNALPVMQPKSKALSNWPLGLKLPLELSFHDESGVKFDAFDQPISNRPSRFDTNLIKAGNNSLTIELVQEGYTVLKANCGPSLTDFVIFDVESGILPNAKIVGVGDVLILETLVEGLNLKKAGKWTSEPNGIIQIQDELALAMRTGNARLIYKMDSDLQLSLNLEVVKATKMAFLPRGDLHLTNDKSKVQAVSLSFISDEFKGQNALIQNSEGLKKANSLASAKSLFSCRAKFINHENDVNNVFKIEPGFHNGNYACLFTALEDSSQFQDEVEISVIPGNGLETLQSEKTKVAFSSLVKVLSKTSITLTNVEPQSEILLNGLDHVLDHVTVSVSDSHFMFVGRSFNKGDNSRAWPLGVKSAFWSEGKPGLDLKLTLVSPLTDQTFVFPVKVQFRGDQCANIELGWSSLIYFLAAHYQSVLFIVASCVICVFITRLVTQASKASSSKPSEKPSVMQTPVRMMQNGSSPILNSDSKPFLWTANDSPVYGSPTISPFNRKSPRSLAQYSYSNQ